MNTEALDKRITLTNEIKNLYENIRQIATKISLAFQDGRKEDLKKLYEDLHKVEAKVKIKERELY